MRKLLLSLICLLPMTGLAGAGEVTFLKFDMGTKEVTVKEGTTEKTYKITDKTKFSGVEKDGTSRDMNYEDAVKAFRSPKAVGRYKFDVTVNGGEITAAKMKARKPN